MSLSLHSTTENVGGGRRSGSDASNSSSSRSWPVKSSIGLMSRKVSAKPVSRNQRNESRWTAIRSGRGRTSSRLEKETRSRMAGREAKNHSFTSASERPWAGARVHRECRQEKRGGHGRDKNTGGDA